MNRGISQHVIIIIMRKQKSANESGEWSYHTGDSSRDTVRSELKLTYMYFVSLICHQSAQCPKFPDPFCVFNVLKKCTSVQSLVQA